MSQQGADVIIHGGTIITMDDNLCEAEAVAVGDGRILCVGSLQQADRYRRPDTIEVDLNGQALLPGFIEAHSHPIMSAITYHHRLDLSGFNGETKEEIWTKLRTGVASTEKGGWIVGNGWNPLLVNGLKNPSRLELDGISSDHHICIYSFHLHNMFCNTKAFEAAKIPIRSLERKNDGFIRDSEGYLTGIACKVPGNATKIMIESAAEISPEVGKKALEAQLRSYAKAGFTSVAALGSAYSFKDSRFVLSELINSPSSPIRLIKYEFARTLKMIKDVPIKGRPGLDSLCQVGVKWHADGSPYSGTMATAEPYLDTQMTKAVLRFPSYPHHGCLNMSEDDLYADMLTYHRQDWQLAVHAHGERAVEQVLNVYERLLKEYPRQDHRYRLEHCGLITRHQLERAKILGVTPSFFVDHVHFFGRALRDDILGKERAERFMPLHDATELDHRWSLHSDSPSGGPLGPMRCLHTAVTRAMRKENSQDAWEILGGEQAVPLDKALRAYTIDAAWQLHHDEFLGSIAPGKIADFTVLSEDPRKIDLYELDAVKITATYRSGKLVDLHSK